MPNRAVRRRAKRDGAKRVVAPPVGPIATQQGPAAPGGIPEVKVDIDYLLRRIGALDVELDVWKNKSFVLEQQLNQVLALQGGQAVGAEAEEDEEPEAPTSLPGAALEQDDLDEAQARIEDDGAPLIGTPLRAEQPEEVAEKAAWTPESTHPEPGTTPESAGQVPDTTPEEAPTPLTVPPEEAHPPESAFHGPDEQREFDNVDTRRQEEAQTPDGGG